MCVYNHLIYMQRSICHAILPVKYIIYELSVRKLEVDKVYQMLCMKRLIDGNVNISNLSSDF